MFTAAIIIISDRASSGEYEDKTGPVISQMLTEAGYQLIECPVIPDERDQIEKTMIRLADLKTALILSAGGTGFSPRDVTPEDARSLMIIMAAVNIYPAFPNGQIG